jgi:hypothetical protein
VTLFLALVADIIVLRSSASSRLFLTSLLDDKFSALVTFTVQSADGVLSVSHVVEVDEPVGLLDSDFSHLSELLEQVAELFTGDISWKFGYEYLGRFTHF